MKTLHISRHLDARHGIHLLVLEAVFSVSAELSREWSNHMSCTVQRWPTRMLLLSRDNRTARPGKGDSHDRTHDESTGVHRRISRTMNSSCWPKLTTNAAAANAVPVACCINASSENWFSHAVTPAAGAGVLGSSVISDYSQLEQIHSLYISSMIAL